MPSDSQLTPLPAPPSNDTSEAESGTCSDKIPSCPVEESLCDKPPLSSQLTPSSALPSPNLSRAESESCSEEIPLFPFQDSSCDKPPVRFKSMPSDSQLTPPSAPPSRNISGAESESCSDKILPPPGEEDFCDRPPLPTQLGPLSAFPSPTRFRDESENCSEEIPPLTQETFVDDSPFPPDSSPPQSTPSTTTNLHIRLLSVLSNQSRYLARSMVVVALPSHAPRSKSKAQQLPSEANVDPPPASNPRRRQGETRPKAKHSSELAKHHQAEKDNPQPEQEKLSSASQPRVLAVEKRSSGPKVQPPVLQSGQSGKQHKDDLTLKGKLILDALKDALIVLKCYYREDVAQKRPVRQSNVPLTVRTSICGRTRVINYFRKHTKSSFRMQ